MSTTAQHVEDLLLDFAYGELSAKDAAQVQSHLDGCAQCKASLEEMQGVRKVMSHLPEQSAPSAGLDSLLAYAEQSARRAQAGPEPKPTWWRKFLAPVTGLAAIVAVGVVAHEVTRDAPTAEAVVNQAVFESAKEAERKPVTAVAPAGDALVQPSAPPPPPPADQAQQAGATFGDVRAPMAEPKAPKRERAEPRAKAIALKDLDDSLREESRAFKGGEGYGGLAGGAGRGVGPGSAALGSGVIGGMETGAKSDSAPVASAPPPSQPAKQKRAASAPAPATRSTELSREVPMAAEAVAEDEGDYREQYAAAEKKSAERADVATNATVTASATARQLSAQAQAARQRGDLREEARLLREAVAIAPSDRVLMGNLLLRLCDVEYDLGNDAAGARACQRAANDYAGTSTAIAAKRRMADRAAQSTEAAEPAKAASPTSTGN